MISYVSEQLYNIYMQGNVYHFSHIKNNINLLIASRDLQLCKALEEYISTNYKNTITIIQKTNSGKTALETIKTQKIDWIISGVELSDNINGYTLFKESKKINSSNIFFFISSYCLDATIKEQAYSLGINACFPKFTPLNQIFEILDKNHF